MSAARSVSVMRRGGSSRAAAAAAGRPGRARPARRRGGPATAAPRPAGARRRCRRPARRPARGGTGPTPPARRSSSRAPASRNARYRIRRARSSASGSGPSSASGTAPSTTRRGSSARDLIRISWLAIATNADTLPIRSPSSDGERVQVGVGERAQRHRQDVELAGLDEGQQQRQRAVERRQRDARGGLGAPALAERDRRALSGGERHQQASSAAWNSASVLRVPGRRPGSRTRSTARADSPAAATASAEASGVVPEPVHRRRASRARAPPPRAPTARRPRPATRRPAGRRRCRPSRSRGAGPPPGRRGP